MKSQKRMYPQSARNPGGVIKMYTQLKAYQEIADATGPTNRDEPTYEFLLGQGSTTAQCLAGSIALDIASRPALDDDAKVLWLQRAHEGYEAVKRKSMLTNTMSAYAINASFEHAVLPAHSALILGGRLPSATVRAKMYNNLAHTGQTALDFYIRLGQKDSRQAQEERRVVNGTMAEMVVLMLHQRFTNTSLNDLSQLALPSYFHQNIGEHRASGSALVDAWDITVHQQFEGEAPTVPYKIQVKSGKSRSEPESSFTYTDDISTVYVCDDLAFSRAERKKGNSNPSRILAELLREHGEQSVGDDAARLETRTSHLLDILDQAA